MPPEEIRNISEKVYRKRLIDGAGGLDAEWKKREPDRMIEKDGDQGQKLRNRAGIYDALVRDIHDVMMLDKTDGADR